MCTIPVAVAAGFRGERSMIGDDHRTGNSRRVVRVPPTGSPTGRAKIAEPRTVAVTHSARVGGLEDKDGSLPLTGGTEFREVGAIALAIATRFWRIHLSNPPHSD